MSRCNYKKNDKNCCSKKTVVNVKTTVENEDGYSLKVIKSRLCKKHSIKFFNLLIASAEGEK